MILILVSSILVLTFTAIDGGNPLTAAQGFGTLKSAYKCMAANGYTDPDLGTVRLAADACQTNLQTGVWCPRMIMCCQPQKPSEVIYQYRFYDKSGQLSQLTWNDKTVPAGFAQCSKIVFVIHGYLENLDMSSWPKIIIDGWVSRGACVIGVDWRLGNGVQYFQSSANVETVGRAVAVSINNWQIGDKTLIIGFSLGGQILGRAGKYYKEISGGKILSEGHALDPAGPLFDGCGASVNLGANDLTTVKVIHTSGQRGKGATGFSGFGTYRKVGKCDYWINCGYLGDQEPCPQVTDFMSGISPSAITGKTLDAIPGGCDHFRAGLIYGSHANNKCPFKSQWCPQCSNEMMGQSPGIDRCLAGAGAADQLFIIENTCQTAGDYYVKIPAQQGQYPFC